MANIIDIDTGLNAMQAIENIKYGWEKNTLASLNKKGWANCAGLKGWQIKRFIGYGLMTKATLDDNLGHTCYVATDLAYTVAKVIL